METYIYVLTPNMICFYSNITDFDRHKKNIVINMHDISTNIL